MTPIHSLHSYLFFFPLSVYLLVGQMQYSALQYGTVQSNTTHSILRLRELHQTTRLDR